ncbi:MAG: hypothetical protein ACYCS8_00500 [Acidithiobacillus sp.]
MEIVEGFDQNPRIYTVAEIEARSRKRLWRGAFAFIVGIALVVLGFWIMPFVHPFEWQLAVFMMILVTILAYIVIWLPFLRPDDCVFVDKPEMLSLCEKIEPYPELRQELCRIVAVRPVLTRAEYWRMADAVDQIRVSAADKETADALAAALKRLSCGDGAVLEK